MRLIYSSANNIRMQGIALSYGLQPGARLPATVYTPPVFADQNWKNPVHDQYIEQLARYRPALATVIDWESGVSWQTVEMWAVDAARHVSEAVIIIPKIPGTVHQIPEQIAGKPIRLGYSVWTRHGGTTVPAQEFGDRPVHLLGGDPDEQIRLSKRMNVVSLDNNYIQDMAMRCQFRMMGARAKRRGWPSLKEMALGHLIDAPYLAFELTCIAMTMLWDGYPPGDIAARQFDTFKARGERINHQLNLF